MKLLNLIATGGLVAVLSTACAPLTPAQLAHFKGQINQQNESNLPKVAATVDSVQGIWISTCFYDTSKYQVYRQDTLRISANGFKINSNYYSDSSCVMSSFQENFSGTFTIANDSITMSNVCVAITANSSIILDDFKQISFCKVSNWTLYAEQTFCDVTSCGFSLTTPSGIKRYGETEMFLGSEKLIKSQ